MRQLSPEERLQKEARLMKEGRKRYVSELRKQLKELHDYCEVNESGRTLETAKHIYRMVHTIKGSAPIFEFIRIGLVAEKLVHVWEWTQVSENGGDAERIATQFQQSVQAGAQWKQQLLMEFDLYCQEMDLDEQQEQFGKLSLAPSGGRLLIIDDDEALRSYLVRRLKLEGYEVDHAADVGSAQKLLREHNYDLITLDLMMHPQSGYELFEFVKEDPTLKWVPLVVLSGRDDIHDKVRCFYLGADDFVTKPFQYEELSARIYSLLKRTKNFEQMAFRDPLTGIYNRRFFDHQIHVELQRISRYPAPISLVFIDIDRFKSINDTHGHHVGDLVLQGLAHVLQKNLRSTDLIARFGGEEFVVVLPGSTAQDAQKSIEFILQQIRSEPVAQNEGQAFHITFSAGVSAWCEGMTIEEWIQRSDDAMYAAKQGGRDRVMIYVDEMGDSSGSLSEGADEHQRLTVLIADDDRILRSILVSKLQHLPVTFLEASDGEEAYSILTQQSVDLCILDGVMPRLGGFELLEKFEQEGSKPMDLSILMLSGRNREDEPAKGHAVGIDVFMHKPFSMVELEMKVKQLLEIQ
ncbi:diguanylate cyclase [Paenibacillus sp. RC67]|uniref:GGDEF domain-containing response regulator n=1 Tax=Paenibacillus sp. RC67 TaxID=3039392 RepID=UPI0024AD6FBA|nr:diguanylate cyclase [Paenibacillus sp. RC67]